MSQPAEIDVDMPAPHKGHLEDTGHQRLKRIGFVAIASFAEDQPLISQRLTQGGDHVCGERRLFGDVINPLWTEGKLNGEFSFFRSE